MESSDFRQWLDYHKGAYPGLAPWLKANPDQLDHWERILSRIELWQAKAATDTLAESDDQPRGYGEHARAIRRLAVEAAGVHQEGYQQRTEGPQVVDDHLVATCARCMDYGIVSVLSPDCLRRIWKEDRSQHLSTCVVACDCERGRLKARHMKVAQWQDGHALFRIDDVLDKAITEVGDHMSIIDAQWEVARDMLHNHEQRSHVHPDFAWYA